MDYTDADVRKHLYRERISLDEFENDGLGALNRVLRERIATTEVARQVGAVQYVLDIFNNAYYITTLIRMDNRSGLHLGDFIKIAQTGSWEVEHSKHPLRRHFEAVTMGMVSLYMHLCAPDWWIQKGCALRNQMEKTYTAQYGDDKAEQVLGTFYGDRFFQMENRGEDVAEWFSVDKEGKPTFDLNVARGVFSPLVGGKSADREMAGYMSELQGMKIQELQKENEELKKQLDELMQPVDSFSAAQKVRMELALQLMEKAGMKSGGYGSNNKIAQVLSVMLDIKSPNNAKGNKAHTCAQYVSSRDYSSNRHKETIEKLNPLLKDLGIGIQL